MSETVVMAGGVASTAIEESASATTQYKSRRLRRRESKFISVIFPHTRLRPERVAFQKCNLMLCKHARALRFKGPQVPVPEESLPRCAHKLPPSPRPNAATGYDAWLPRAANPWH